MSVQTAQELPTLYQEYIFKTRYARWNDDKGRRETWSESVDRYVKWLKNQAFDHGIELDEVEDQIRSSILNLEVMPSMRAFMTAGPALERDNVAGYNCAYIAIDSPRAFDESMYILMCGTGIGFSVERQYVNKLPELPEEFFETDDLVVVSDSRKGWAGGYRKLLALLWSGHVPQWDLSKLRPSGAPLKTFGGRSAGPAPLDDLFRYTIAVFKEAAGRKLTSIECHGLMCKIGDIVVSGGVRRSALISLSNPSDDRMRDAKSGRWYEISPHYQLANNSAAWTEKPDAERFLEEMTALVKSKSGERGIVNREALKRQVEKYGKRDSEHEFGVNPCSEIILRSAQFCNLSSIIVRSSDTEDDLIRKANIASILGTIQATLTDFKYLRPIWKKNCEEERLIGVSLNGLMDHPVLSEPTLESMTWLRTLRKEVETTNAEWSERLGISPAAAGTCIKPEGTSSQLVRCGSGMHRWHSEYIIRRTRDSKGDPAAEVVRMAGVPCEEDRMKPENWVMSWPIAAPEGAKTREDETALEQLKMWLHVNEHYCEHKPSITVSVRDHEWPEVIAFTYNHWDKMSGISFLPHSDHIYQQAPYESTDVEGFGKLLEEMPETIDWGVLAELEKTDMTSSAKELACSAGTCEI